jgi:hypothetical protein
VPRLTRGLSRLLRRGRNDRGAVATVVAILLAGGVLLGMTALVVDVGRIYVEREELQSGADAAALEVALDCAMGRSACSHAGALAKADDYADDNAKDDQSDANVVCGRDSGGRLPSCGPETGNLSNCIGSRPASGNYVEVRTTTRTSGGDTLLPPSFAQAVVDGYEGTTVSACARVAWGSSAGGLAVTISTCEWNKATNNGTTFAPAPPATPSASAEIAVYLHATKDATTCPAGPSGWDAPGGFGWLDDSSPADCMTVILGNEYDGDTGVSASGACKDALEDARDDRTVVLIPIYDGVQGTGSNTSYHLAGVAAFVVTGYHLPGLDEKSTLTNKHLCKGDEKCIYGYFTKALVPWPGPIGSLPGLGAVVVSTVG